ncbi:bifunctional aspartate kinase/diaminopimelate decarboxylase [Marinicella gelatinilytica]|uniref:bifunctional aspartate kinase/diaminopimelate decarboxylase n=1 Tax=Marinicella gelatinilytica TaxID=2996017 RepID=UPI002260C927|nr:bifunctional aspartate kinase/diaminopimelate decarboxylase [Marinicella gelatinilytica]MCX7544462.1 bifunctional aspartate kinase/diaminopimelate decarboxylase [Marinicella gelatinilytica]
MTSRWRVLKFGGSSVSTPEQWQTILQQVTDNIHQGYRVLLVHSACYGLTNALEEKIKTGHSVYKSIEQRLNTLAQDFAVSIDVFTEDLQQLHQLCELSELNNYQQAELLSWGERITHRLIINHINKTQEAHSLNPKDWLTTTVDDHRNPHSRVLSAKCQVQNNPQLQDKLQHQFYVMPGFFAADESGRTVLLGRSGSDTSAAYMAVLLNAERIEIWTDVDGIFSANPHQIPEAKLLLRLSYQEAREIAASGGTVIHPRSILPAEQNNIPIYIKNSLRPEAPGTILKHEFSPKKPRVSAVNTRHQVTLVSMESVNMWHQAGFISDLFAVYKDLGLSVDLISTAQTNVTISLDAADNVLTPYILAKLKDQLAPLCDVTIIANCSAVTLVGYRIRAMADTIASVVATFADQRIYITTQSTNDLNQTFVVDEDQADKLARALHEVLITRLPERDDFGPSWADLVARRSKTKTITQTWWQQNRQQLLDLAQQHSPCYVYHLDTISRQIDKLKSLTAVDRFFYAMKANSQPDVLSRIYQQGIGLETVSPGEIRRCLEIMPKSDVATLLFTPNFAPIEEYQLALQQGITTTIDNPSLLYLHPHVFQNQSVILRLDPGHGSGHHRYVRTAGEQSKFGIPESELPKLATWCQQQNIHICGLHAHTGSGILDHQNWQRIAHFLARGLRYFTDVRIINVGGGLGIKENPGDTGLNFSALNKSLLEFKKQYPSIELWMEPGRFLVAHSGVLLAKVTQTKLKGNQGYIGLETGMNSLIRPALYGAWHNIVNLSRLDAVCNYTANIVGPMCESGDILGIDRPMPDTQAGDVVLIANTGAYGATMASRYNLREPAQELIFRA